MVLEPTSTTEYRLKASPRNHVVKPHTAHDTVPPPRVIYSGLRRRILISSAPARREPALERGGSHLEERTRRRRSASEKGGALATLKKPDAKVRDYDAHVLVCKGGDCKKRGSKDVRRRLKDELRGTGHEQGRPRRLRGLPRPLQARPERSSSTRAAPGTSASPRDDVPEIVEQHLKDGEPVEHLAAEFRPRKTSKMSQPLAPATSACQHGRATPSLVSNASASPPLSAFVQARSAA